MTSRSRRTMGNSVQICSSPNVRPKKKPAKASQYRRWPPCGRPLGRTRSGGNRIVRNRHHQQRLAAMMARLVRLRRVSSTFRRASTTTCSKPGRRAGPGRRLSAGPTVVTLSSARRTPGRPITAGATRRLWSCDDPRCAAPSAGAPSKSILPPGAMTISRSAPRTSARLCVVMTTAVPESARDRNVSMRAAAEIGSSPAVGSSRMQTSGWITRSVAINTLALPTTECANGEATPVGASEGFQRGVPSCEIDLPSWRARWQAESGGVPYGRLDRQVAVHDVVLGDVAKWYGLLADGDPSGRRQAQARKGLEERRFARSGCTDHRGAHQGRTSRFTESSRHRGPSRRSMDRVDIRGHQRSYGCLEDHGAPRSRAPGTGLLESAPEESRRNATSVGGAATVRRVAGQSRPRLGPSHSNAVLVPRQVIRVGVAVHSNPPVAV